MLSRSFCDGSRNRSTTIDPHPYPLPSRERGKGINRETMNKLLSHWMWLIVAILVSGSLRAADTAPNVLIILSDDQSAPHLGCYGNKDIHTPNIDKLASEGMRFDRAYQTAPQCAPARAAMLTGRHTIDIGMIRFSAALPREVVL